MSRPSRVAVPELLIFRGNVDWWDDLPIAAEQFDAYVVTGRNLPDGDPVIVWWNDSWVEFPRVAEPTTQILTLRIAELEKRVTALEQRT